MGTTLEQELHNRGFGRLQMHDLCQKYIQPGWHCLDVGAHAGSMSWAMLRALKGTGRVWAWEPDSLVYDRYLSRRRFDNFNSYNRAVWSHTGTCAYAPDASPLRVMGTAGQGSDMVACDALTDWWLSNGSPDVRLIKISTNNLSDESILQGARELIMTARPLIAIENHFKEIDRCLTDMRYGCVQDDFFRVYEPL